MTGVPALFGILVQEQNPLRFADFLPQLQVFLQDAGGFAAVGLGLWVLFAAFAPSPLDPTDPTRRRVGGFMTLMGVLALVLYVATAAVMLVSGLTQSEAEAVDAARKEQFLATQPPTLRLDAGSVLLTLAGLFAILGILDPFARDLRKLRWRRILALASIAFKEAYRRRVIWVFLVFGLVFLFPPKWFFPIKAEDELKTNVAVIYFAMTPLLLLTAGLLASFSIPTDVRSQTIHTIVTKPVERFEIVLGRFLGFTALLSAALAIMTAFSLTLIQVSNVDEAAREESLKARQPLYGQLSFFNNKDKEGFQGDSVGREWEYRRYIAGGERSSQRAIWNLAEVPRGMAAGRPAVPLEFAFDIFRTTKGEENRGVLVSVQVMTHSWGSEQKKREYEAEARAAGVFEQNVAPEDPRWAKVQELATKYGFFEYRNKQITDYHTENIPVPPGVFENAREGTPPAVPDGFPGGSGPRLRVFVKCESPTQYLGMAPYDLYFLEGEGSFTANFFKGALGLWCRLVIVIAIAVSVSTYLNGIISLLVVIFLTLAGGLQDYIGTLAQGTNYGGGPLESLNRLVRGDNLTVQLDRTPTVQAAQLGDEGFRWLLRRVINVIPDVDRFNWTNYVAEGFNLSGEFVFMNLLFLLAYLLPWGVLAYYLMRSREVATW